MADAAEDSGDDIRVSSPRLDKFFRKSLKSDSRNKSTGRIASHPKIKRREASRMEDNLPPYGKDTPKQRSGSIAPELIEAAGMVT